MKRHVVPTGLVILVLGALLLPVQGQNAGGNRLAVVFGVEYYEYGFRNLSSAAKDARNFADALEKLGYDPAASYASARTKVGVSRGEAISKLRAVMGAATETDTLVIYMAGHGSRRGGQEYLLFSDADPENLTGTALRVAGVPGPGEAPTLESLLKGCRAGKRLLVLDVCRTTRVPGAGAARAGFEGEALDRRFKERLDEVVQARPADVGAVQAAVLWACGPGQISHEDEAGGVFTQGLVAALQAGRRTTGELVAAAAARVPVELRGKQEPVLSGPANLRLAEDIGPPRERLRAGTVKKNPKDGAAVVWVPAGEFRMGDAAGDSDEKPVRRVRLTRGYWLYRTEVTNAQYRRFLEKNPGHREPSYWNNARFNGSGQPVVGVSWEDAAAYCEWAGARLPTEAEWEYAARGPQGRKYPWGEQAPNASLAVFGDTGQPAAVGSKPGGASWCGALDLAGNVWEWCADWYDGNFYRGRPDPDVDPVRSIKDSSQYRVLRGGSWSNVALDLRSANRNYFEPDFRYVIFGFRAVAAAAED